MPWLFKTEPSAFSFADLWAAPQRRAPWDGVRNYQARNLLRDAVKLGHMVLVYHSSIPQPHVAGVAQVVGEAEPDPTAVDPQSKYYDARPLRGEPRWFQVHIEALAPLHLPVSLAAMRAEPALADLPLLRRGQRLSIQPVSEGELAVILAMGKTAL